MISSILNRIPAKKRILANTLELSGMLPVINRITEENLIIFNFHRMKPTPRDHSFCDEVYGPDADVFTDYLKWMKLYADPVSEQDIINSIYSNEKLPRKSFLVTFDDGYRDNFEVALPILKRENVPGIFFVTTGFLTDQKLGWWDTIYWFLKKTSLKRFTLHNDAYDLTTHSIDMVAETIIQKIKSLEYGQLEMALNQLSLILKVSFPTASDVASELMTWEQLRTAMNSGISVGSHTHTHPILANLTDEEQKQEFTLSKKILEENLGTTIQSLSFPVGGYEHISTNSSYLAKEAGYKLAFSFLTGINKASQMNAFDIKRLDWFPSRVEYRCAFALPDVFAQRKCTYRSPRIPQ